MMIGVSNHLSIVFCLHYHSQFRWASIPRVELLKYHNNNNNNNNNNTNTLFSLWATSTFWNTTFFAQQNPPNPRPWQRQREFVAKSRSFSTFAYHLSTLWEDRHLGLQPVVPPSTSRMSNWMEVDGSMVNGSKGYTLYCMGYIGVIAHWS